ncbi:MAG: amidohydrolase family protein [Bifidobacteriaceae bacterium]|jgi:predicted TIM-barrel fold metal-dependent hydrolase|nr:amidohydrolase family protein [Bifidobacteriaceae bacterium]
MTMIIDLHMHVEDVAALGWTMSAADCLAAMDEAQVDLAAIMTLTDYPGLNPHGLELIADAVAAHPGRLVGFARLNPVDRPAALAALERAVTELGFKGLKLHPVSTLAHPGDEATVALIRRAGELGVPTLFHCGDEAYTTPLAVAQAAKQCPRAKIILGHMGGFFHVDEALAVAQALPNILLETSGMPYPERIAEAVRLIGPERVLFGSDGPIASPAVEKRKVLLAGLAAGDLELVLGGNAAHLLGVAA